MAKLEPPSSGPVRRLRAPGSPLANREGGRDTEAQRYLLYNGLTRAKNRVTAILPKCRPAKSRLQAAPSLMVSDS